jgi:hypothetical protein
MSRTGSTTDGTEPPPRESAIPPRRGHRRSAWRSKIKTATTWSSAITDSLHPPRATAPRVIEHPSRTCLGRTCLKWSADGELTSVDLLPVLERLAQVDQEATILRQDSLDSQPCPSIS